jgi:hypothetical protein
MADFDSMLAAAQKLPAQELVRLIDALWGSLPDDAELPLHDHRVGNRTANSVGDRS